jgi:hypothetical protein
MLNASSAKSGPMKLLKSKMGSQNGRGWESSEQCITDKRYIIVILVRTVKQKWRGDKDVCKQTAEHFSAHTTKKFIILSCV